MPNPGWTSFCQFVQHLIAGNVRRNTFSQWEIDLLLDIGTTPMRRSSRPEMLRRYLKTVQRQLAGGAPSPIRFSEFFENETHLRKNAALAEPEVVLPRAS